jgi:putative endonuclease
MAEKKNKEYGKAGEDYTVGYLEQKGYKILERNWQDGHRELDIIAMKDDLTIFVEVKARSGIEMGFPEESITKKKIKNLKQAAENYMLLKNVSNVRFDVMALIFIEGQKPDAHYVEDAF